MIYFSTRTDGEARVLCWAWWVLVRASGEVAGVVPALGPEEP